MLALQLGRPSGIADKDIDIEFPLNIDHDVTDPKLIFEMQNRQIEITRDMLPGEEYARGYDQVNSVRIQSLADWETLSPADTFADDIVDPQCPLEPTQTTHSVSY